MPGFGTFCATPAKSAPPFRCPPLASDRATPTAPAKSGLFHFLHPRKKRHRAGCAEIPIFRHRFCFFAMAKNAPSRDRGFGQGFCKRAGASGKKERTHRAPIGIPPPPSHFPRPLFCNGFCCFFSHGPVLFQNHTAAQALSPHPGPQKPAPK